MRLSIEPVDHRVRGAGLDDVDPLIGADNNDRGHPALAAPAASTHEQSLIHRYLGHRAYPGDVGVDQPCAPRDDGVVDRLPISTQLSGHRRDAVTVFTYLARRPPARPSGELVTWGKGIRSSVPVNDPPLQRGFQRRLTSPTPLTAPKHARSVNDTAEWSFNLCSTEHDPHTGGGSSTTPTPRPDPLSRPPRRRPQRRDPQSSNTSQEQPPTRGLSDLEGIEHPHHR